MSEWQIFETAPKTGQFLFWIPDAEVPGIGWLHSKGKVVTEDGSVGFPSHWMPLPSPPKTPNDGD